MCSYPSTTAWRRPTAANTLWALDLDCDGSSQAHVDGVADPEVVEGLDRGVDLDPGHAAVWQLEGQLTRLLVDGRHVDGHINRADNHPAGFRARWRLRLDFRGIGLGL